MVAASKLKKAQDRMQNIKPYAESLSTSIQNLLPNINLNDIDLASNFSKSDKTLVLAISSNRGLCGGFNANIFKKIHTSANYKNMEVIGVGKKAADLFQRNKHTVSKVETTIMDNPTFTQSKAISQEIINSFIQGSWSKVVIVYNTFKNAATQVVVEKQLLPISVEDRPTEQRKDYIFDPDKTTIVNNLIPNQVHTQFFEAILNSFASEHGARMTAMHKATDNANELKQNLTLSYNRQRQAAITNEILEIVAGAEALSD